MKSVIVNPNQGIGKFYLGMTRKAVEEIVNGLIINHEQTKENFIEKNHDMFHFSYEDDLLSEVCLTNFENCSATLHEIDLFNTKAEKIIDVLNKISDCKCDCEDEDLGTTYYFKDLGLTLWRERAYHPKLLNDSGFQNFIKMNKENLEYEQRFWYFSQIKISKNTTLNKATKPEFWSLNEGLEYKEPSQKEIEDMSKKLGL